MTRPGFLAWLVIAGVACAPAPPSNGLGPSNNGAVQGGGPAPDPSSTATVTAGTAAASASGTAAASASGTAAASASGTAAAPASTATAVTSATAPGSAPTIPAGAVGALLASETICPPRFPRTGGSRGAAPITSAEAAEKALGCAPAGVDFTRYRIYLVPLSGTNQSFTFSSKDIVRDPKGIVLKPSIHSQCRGAAMRSEETFFVLLPAGTEPVTVTPTFVPLARPCLAP